MAGQQNLKELSIDSLYSDTLKSLVKEVDLWYINDKYNIQTNHNENNTLYLYLIKTVYDNKNCQIYKDILENNKKY